MDTNKEGVAAWLLQVDRLVNVAIGQFELIHIVDEPDYLSVPQAPEYCRNVILWNDNIVPVICLTSWASGNVDSDNSGIVAIVVYKGIHNNYTYGGIKLDTAPVQARVKNDQQCQLTDNLITWEGVSLSCFKSSTGDIVPIIDITKLFSPQHIN